MVEKPPYPGWWPELAAPLRAARERIADWFAPPSEASADAEAYTIVVELPGVPEEGIHLSVHERILGVRGEKKSEQEEKGETFYFSERTYGVFQRSFRLPEDADEGGITAAMKDGVLTIRVPKLHEPPAASRQIEVRKA